ncbi:MAG: glycosyltransferase family 39 protein, partial [Bacteroidota bacterium]
MRQRPKIALESTASASLSFPVFTILVCLLVLLRLFHLEPFIDDPHAWRQCDTAYYIYDFYKNGIDLLHPAVCWMGGQETLALEFPLPEALVAILYGIFGEHLFLARLVFLFFFLGMAYYFYQLVDLWWGRGLAQMSTLILMCMPLGIYYSRAIHIDCSALFFAYGMFYYYCRAINHQRSWDMAWSAAMAIPAFLIKVPYVFYLALPMLVYALHRKALWWVLRRSWLYLFPIGAFVLWQQQVYQINTAAPDWDYILHYRKFDENTAWYFGTLAQRLRPYSWWILLKRGVLEVVGMSALLFFIWGLIVSIRKKGYYLVYAWCLGVLMYVLIFFNLNFIHNYYQLPLMAPAAILAAWGLMDLSHRLHQYWRGSLRQLKVLLLLFIFTGQMLFTEKAYYQIPHLEIEIGQLLRSHTPEEALLITSYAKYDCRNPKLLYRARRRGWSIEEAAIQASLIQRLHQEEGASHWAYIGAELPIDPTKLQLDSTHMQRFDLA